MKQIYKTQNYTEVVELSLGLFSLKTQLSAFCIPYFPINFNLNPRFQIG